LDESLVFLYSADDEFGEKSVSVLLDGEESEIIFIDHPSSEMSVSLYFAVSCLPFKTSTWDKLQISGIVENY
jgi:hypothetical protein